MNMKGKFVSTRPIGKRNTAGIGNIIIPKDVDPVQYVTSCFRTNKVSICFEDGGLMNNVLVSTEALRNINFPSDYTSLGTQVLWINKPKTNQPMIIGTFAKNNELIPVSRYKDSLRKSSKNSVAEIIVDSNKGVVIVNSNSTTDSGGDIYILSTNKNASSKLNVQVSGNINIIAPILNMLNSKSFSFTVQDPTVDDKVTTFTYTKGTGWSYKDEFGNEWYFTNDNIQFKPQNKFNIGNGNEPLVLGNTLQTNVEAEQNALTALFTAIQSAPVTPGDGGATFKAALIAAIKTIVRGDYSKILSTVSNTD